MEVSSSTVIKVSQKQVVVWFDSIGQKPNRYQFATHGGVVIISGRLDRPGAIFETREQFFGLPVRLQFQITQVEPDKFTFQLIKPLGRGCILGQFLLTRLGAQETRLTLRIFGGKPESFLTGVLQILFFASPLRWAIRKQIRAEVEFIRQAVEKK